MELATGVVVAGKPGNKQDEKVDKQLPNCWQVLPHRVGSTLLMVASTKGSGAKGYGLPSRLKK